MATGSLFGDHTAQSQSDSSPQQSSGSLNWAEEIGGGVARFAQVFGKSVFRSAIQDTYNGVSQLVDAGTNALGLGNPLPQMALVQGPEATKLGSGDWFAQTLGSGLGMVAPFLLADFGVGKAVDSEGGLVSRMAEQGGLAGKLSPLIRPTLSGAAYGLVFTPTDGKGNFFQQRATNAIVGGATFGVMRAASMGVMGGLSGLGVPLSDSLFQKSAAGIATRIGSNMAGGAFAGAANAEATSLLGGHGLANRDLLANSVGAFVVTGGALDAAHIAWGAFRPGSQTSSNANAQGDLPSSGSGHMMDVQARMTQDFSGEKGNSQAVAESARSLKDSLTAKLGSTISDQADLDFQKQQFNQLIDNLAVREYDGVGMNGGHLTSTYAAVDRLISQDKLAVDLSPDQRLGLAKQILNEAAKPYRTETGNNNTAEAQGVQGLLLDRVPGKLANGIVDLVTTGKYSTNRADPVHVDLLESTLAQLPDGYRTPLAPDSEAQSSLERAASGRGELNSEGQRTYASQLAQLLITNVHTQGAADSPAYYVKGAPDSTVAGDTGERLFARDSDGKMVPAFEDGQIEMGAKIKTANLQAIFDHISGVDNDSLVLKNGNDFLVMNPHGTVPDPGSGNLARFGLYNGDMRFLSAWDVRINGETPTLKSADLGPGYAGKFVYDNAPAPGLTPNAIELSRDVVINNGLGERLTVKNNSDLPQNVHLSVGFDSDYRDMFEVRGWQRPARGTLNVPVIAEQPGASGQAVGAGDPVAEGESARARGSEPSSGGLGAGEGKAADDQGGGATRVTGRVQLSYSGLDRSTYTTDISVRSNDAPATLTARGVSFTLSLPPGAEHAVELSAEPGVDKPVQPPADVPSYEDRLKDADTAYEKWRASAAKTSTGNPEFNTVLDRAFRDLYMLRIQTPRGDGIAAGIPWYVAGFGRDQLITSLQTLPFVPDLAKGVIEQLAAYQGTKNDPMTAEKPGKIMHELRVGEMAKNGEIPFTPYYGTVDATPLWLMLLGKYVDTTGDTDLAARMQPHVDSALKYLESETERTGYLTYGGHGAEALSNQGWKDSGDSVMHEDGTLLKAPITLAEPQGYLYSAWQAAGKLADMNGDSNHAADLYGKAESLKERFNNDFWMPEENFAALALDGQGKQAQVISSNPGQLLSTGILTPEHAFAVEDRLMQDDMFSGFGIRTLSSNEARYNPGSYHNGTIWPHDDGMIGEGIHDLVPASEDGNRLMMGLFDAARNYPEFRLPELFDGFDRAQYQEPIPYPETSSPQAWAAGSMLQLLRSNLGLHVDAGKNEVLLWKPAVPPELGQVTIDGLRVGQNTVALHFARETDGTTSVSVLSNPGNVNIVTK